MVDLDDIANFGMHKLADMLTHVDCAVFPMSNFVVLTRICCCVFKEMLMPKCFVHLLII